MPHRRDVLIGAAAIGSALAMPSILKAQTRRRLRMGHIFPATHPYHRGLQKFGEELSRLTNGAITVEVYPASQLGGEIEMLGGMKLGTVDGCACGVSHVATSDSVRKFYLLDMPFLFKDYAAVERFFASDFAREFFDDLPKRAGLRILADGTAGFHQILNSKRPIRQPADLKGLKIRIWESPSAILALELMGMTPTPMAFSEVFTALQQGVIDGITNSLTTFYTTKLFEAAKHISISNHMYVFIPIIISERTFSRLGEPEQKAMIEAGKIAGKFWRSLYSEDDLKNTELLKAAKVSFNDVDVEAFRKHVEPGYQRFVELVNEPGAKELADRLAKAGGY